MDSLTNACNSHLVSEFCTEFPFLSFKDTLHSHLIIHASDNLSLTISSALHATSHYHNTALLRQAVYNFPFAWRSTLISNWGTNSLNFFQPLRPLITELASAPSPALIMSPNYQTSSTLLQEHILTTDSP